MKHVHSMKAIFVLIASLALVLVMAIPAIAASDEHGNVGTAHDFGFTIQDAAGHIVGYTCSYVHETIVPGGLQDKQTCKLADGAVLPKTKTTYVGVPFEWASDYQYVTNQVFLLAATWSYSITPGGTIVVVSFYPNP